jgi:hypothetical protein
MSENVRDPGLTAFEAALGGLTPAPPRFDRDRLLFRAGQAAARRGRFWPCAAAGFAALAASLGGLLLLRPAAQETVRIVHVPVHEPAPVPPAPAVRVQPPPEERPQWPPRPDPEWTRLSYGALLPVVLRWGVEGLPSGTANPARTAADKAPARLGEVPSYYQLRVSYLTGGER